MLELMCGPMLPAGTLPAITTARRHRADMFLPFWQRLLITIGAILILSYVAGAAWQWVFNFALPSYLAGMVGGLAALPTWDLLKRIRPKA
jgi:hypothetical protein